MAGAIIIPILEMEILRLRVKILPQFHPGSLAPEPTLSPTGPGHQMHKLTPGENATSETNLPPPTSQMRTLVPPPPPENTSLSRTL